MPRVVPHQQTLDGATAFDGEPFKPPHDPLEPTAAAADSPLQDTAGVNYDANGHGGHPGSLPPSDAIAELMERVNFAARCARYAWAALENTVGTHDCCDPVGGIVCSKAVCVAHRAAELMLSWFVEEPLATHTRCFDNVPAPHIAFLCVLVALKNHSSALTYRVTYSEVLHACAPVIAEQCHGLVPPLCFSTAMKIEAVLSFYGRLVHPTAAELVLAQATDLDATTVSFLVKELDNVLTNDRVFLGFDQCADFEEMPSTPTIPAAMERHDGIANHCLLASGVIGHD